MQHSSLPLVREAQAYGVKPLPHLPHLDDTQKPFTPKLNGFEHALYSSAPSFDDLSHLPSAASHAVTMVWPSAYQNSQSLYLKPSAD
jgi:hypothetical protein